jgi:TRAP-type C4-dicarboxylate transport system substrate-binding protein
MKVLLRVSAVVLAVLFLGQPAEAKTIKIKLATLAPDGSVWNELLKDLARDWEEASGGRVALRIYPGGVAGDEPVVMKKMAIDNYNAALISSQGLSAISKPARVFTIPRMLRNNEELDKALHALAPELEQELAAKGYIVLFWADAGWVKFFVPTPDADIESVRKVKLFSWAGDSEGLELWRSAGFNVVPLPATELITALKTKLVDAFDTMPYYALMSQAYRHTDYMIDMKWAPLPGALIITKASWDRIPADLQPVLKAKAAEYADRFRTETRRMAKDAVDAMTERGLKVVTPTPAELEQWDREAKAAYPKIRGFYVSEAMFDRFAEVVKRIRETPTAGGSR